MALQEQQNRIADSSASALVQSIMGVAAEEKKSSLQREGSR